MTSSEQTYLWRIYTIPALMFSNIMDLARLVGWTRELIQRAFIQRWHLVRVKQKIYSLVQVVYAAS